VSSVTALMAAECKRLLAQRRAQRRVQLEAAVGDSRRLLVEQQVVDLSVRCSSPNY